MSERFNDSSENPGASAWNMGDVPSYGEQSSAEVSAEKLNAERQQRKIIACYLTTVGDKVNTQAIAKHDVELPEGAREEVLRRINSGEIGEKQEEEILLAVASDMELDGARSVFGKIGDYHERKILAYLTDGNYNQPSTTSVNDLLKLYDENPSALDFEKSMSEMVETVRRLNNDTKAEAYRVAGESLMQKMYGKQCEYLAQMKSLRAEAAELDENNDDGSRQQRKIIAAFLTAMDGHVGMKAIADHDASLPEGAREEVLDRINNGKIDRLLERDLLRSVSSSMDLDGAPAVMSSLTDKHEYRIASWMSGHGFNEYASLEPRNLEDLYSAYPTPLDFEYALPGLVKHIREYNGDQKAAEYQAAGESLMQKMYGKQCEYWEQVKVLNKEAAEKKKREMGSGPTERLAGNDAVSRRAEMERNSEWAPGVAAFCQTSRKQSLEALVNRELIDRGLKAGESCEDSVLCRPDSGLFGVFDGAGGEGFGGEASRFVAQMIERYHDAYGTETLDDLIGSVESTMVAMDEHKTRGMTTAVLSKVITQGDKKYLAYVNIGDSRLYVVNKNGEATQITVDEGYGNVITNAMSATGGAVKQYGTVPVEAGDRIVLCSDGITGDRGYDLMSNEELASIVMGSKNADDAAKNLVTKARKRDDRTALVFSV